MHLQLNDPVMADTRPMAGPDTEPAPLTEALKPLAEQLAALRQVVQTLQHDAGRAVRQLAEVQERQRVAAGLAAASRAARKEPRAVFVGRSFFGCNLKYAWLATARRAAELGIECWYLPQDDAQEQLMKALGLPHFPHHPLHWSGEHVRTALHAAVAVTGERLTVASQCNPHVPALLAGAHELQLWHGIALKEAGLQRVSGLAHLSAAGAEALAACGSAACWAGAAAAAEDGWRRSFRFERYAVTGHARNDVLLREPGELDLVNVDAHTLAAARAARAAGRRVVLYAPTYRAHVRGQWLLNVGLEQWAQAAQAQGDLLLVSLHPFEQGMAAQLRPRYPSLQVVAPGTDVMPLLRDVDVLVSDYAGLMLDYLLLDRPVVLWRPDPARFASPHCRLRADADDILPGPAVSDVEDLIRLLQGDPAELAAAFAGARAALRQRHFDHVDAGSADRVAELVAELVHARVDAGGRA